MSTEVQQQPPPQEAPVAEPTGPTGPFTIDSSSNAAPTTEQAQEQSVLGPGESKSSDKGTAEAIPNVANPVKEEKVGKDEVKVQAKPINEGILNYKGSGLKGLLFSKKYFWISDAPLESKNLSAYLGNEKNKDLGHANASHATQTGKGLLFYAKRAEDKDHPQGILNLADLTDLAKGNFNDFSANLNGHKHTFQAQTRAERDSWLVTLEPKLSEAKTAKEGIIGSEGYKKQLETYAKPTAAAGSISKSRSLSRPNKASKSRERTKEAAPAKETKESKAETQKEATPAAAAAAAPAPTKTDASADKSAKTDAKKDKAGEQVGEVAAGVTAGGATAAAAARKGSSDDDKKDKKGRSQSRGNKRGSIFGGLLGRKDEPEDKKTAKKEEKKEEKKEKKEEKKEEKNLVAAVKKDEKKEKKEDEKVEKKAEKDAEKQEKKVEKEVEKADKHDEKAAKADESAATAAAGAAAATGVAATKKSDHEKKDVVEPAPISTTEPTKSADATPISTTKEKPNKRTSMFGGIFGKKESAASPTEKAEETTPVASEPPQLDNPVTASTENPLTVPSATEEPKTNIESPAATSATTPSDKRRTSFFSGLGTKKEKKPETAVEEDKKKKIEPTSGDETTDGEKKKKEGGFGGLLRKASRAQPKKDHKPPKTEGAAVPILTKDTSKDIPKDTSAGEKAIKEGEKQIMEGAKVIREGEAKIDEGEKALREASSNSGPAAAETSAAVAKPEEVAPVATKV